MELEGRLAVVTGGGTGMGRELVLQLVDAGCAVAACDVFTDTLAETGKLAAERGPVRVTTHQCDVIDPAAVERFRDDVLQAHETDHVNLLFNNAGIGGGGSFIHADQDEWERTFAVCWTGVYNCSRAFVPLLVASDAGYLINTSSVNGFWANLGPQGPHTAYSAAKFAVKGFSEALLTDFAVNAPHVQVAVVMPGHIGTSIVANTVRTHQGTEMPEEARAAVEEFSRGFEERARTSAAEAATIILDGVREDRWRILVGPDAEELDRVMREDPEEAYAPGGTDITTVIGRLP